jgi:sterol desaturase/sphingolipid hydroxylase (fatty acid hydroxylase superfamily)
MHRLATPRVHEPHHLLPSMTAMEAAIQDPSDGETGEISSSFVAAILAAPASPAVASTRVDTWTTANACQ